MTDLVSARIGPNAKLAELLALATDIKWSASFSDRQDAARVYARSECLPGCHGFHIDLQTSAIWRARPDAYSLSRDEAAFWQRFSTQENNPFGGFDVAFADLAVVLPGTQMAIVLDGLRAIAARREESVFWHSSAAQDYRAVIRRYDRSWACPVRVAAGQFEDPDHRLRIEHVNESDTYRPSRCWVLREVSPYPRLWFLPGWWATRRAADDEGRRVLASKTARDQLD